MNALISECPEGFETAEKGKSYSYKKDYTVLTITECANRVKDSGYSFIVFDPEKSNSNCKVFEEAADLYKGEIQCKISKYFIIFYQE